MSFSNRKNLFLFGFILVLLAAIPLTVFVLQKQQQTKIGATPATTLSFSPASIQKAKGDIFNVDVIIDPGTNQVGFVNLKINFDPEILSPSSEGTSCGKVICGNSDALAFEEVEIIDGEMGATFSKRMDFTRVIQTQTKLATVTFKALKATTTPTQLTFSGATIVHSGNVQGGDIHDENVLSTRNPASVTITEGTGPTPTPTGTGGPTPTGTLTRTPTPTQGVNPDNESPVCTSLNVDRETTGDAPFSIAFTANGTDTDGQITKATFNFGDGPVQDVAQAGGIGTDSVSVQISHTYRNPGTFQASTILTDNNGGVSDSTTCTQTITVTKADTVPTEPVDSEPTPIVLQPTLPPTGPTTAVLGAGIGGVVLSIIGVIIFLAL